MDNLKGRGIQDIAREAITEFPTEVLSRIFLFSDYESILKSTAVSKQWLSASEDPVLWADKYRQDFGGQHAMQHTREEYDNEWQMRFGTAQIRTVTHRPVCVVTSTVEVGLWKTQAWKFLDSTAVGFSGISYGGLGVVDLDTGKDNVISTKSGVMSVACDGKTVFVGFRDGSIGWWDLQSRVHTKTSFGHSFVVSGLDCDAGMLVSGGWDRVVKLWKIKTGECVKTLVDLSQAVTAVKISKARILAALCDRSVIVWDRGTGERLNAIYCGGMNSSLRISPREIVSVGSDASASVIKVFDARDGKIVSEIQPGKFNVASTDVHGNKVACGFDDGSLKLWDMRTGLCIRTVDNLKCTPRHIDFQGQEVFLVCSDGHIKKLHFGKCA